jgi:iron-sulfur cluster assembly accessory protein
MIHLTRSAIAEISRLMSSRSRSKQAFCRLQIQEGGCANFYYSLGSDETVAAHDETLEIQGIPFVLDTKTYNHTTDLTIDYSEDLMGGGFRFHNPNAVKTCGCGNSFSLAEPIEEVTTKPGR